MRVRFFGLAVLPLLLAMAPLGAARADDGGDAASTPDDASTSGDAAAQTCDNNAVPDDAGACTPISESKVGGCALGVSAHTAREGIGAVGLVVAISIAIARRRRAPRDLAK